MTSKKLMASLLMLFSCKSLDALTVDANVLGFGATRNQAIEMAAREYQKYRQIAATSSYPGLAVTLSQPMRCIHKQQGLYECQLGFHWSFPE